LGGLLNPYTFHTIYDGEGKRVKKISDTENTIFVYNGGGTLVAEYSVATNSQSQPKISYLTTDHLGSPRIITDQVGKVVSRHDYLAYGDDIAETLGNVGGRNATQGYGQEDNVRKQYTGYERDDESGLDYAQARYYNSKQGRFTSVDPLTASANIKDPQTFNRYTYALNSPYKFTDPLGLIAENSNNEQQDDDCACPKKKKKNRSRQTRPKPKQPATQQPTQRPRQPVAQQPAQQTSQSQATQPEQEDDTRVQVEVVTGNSEKIAKEVAKTLNEGYQKEQSLINGAIPTLGTAAVKSIAKELGETFNPTASAGTDSSVKIDVPSPGPIIAEIVGAGADIADKIIQNRIETETKVNLVLMNADVDMQGNVDESEISPTLIQARRRGLEMHEKARKRKSR
jgi:RHS repeat-associated protein